jgi:hypothetical protein
MSKEELKSEWNQDNRRDLSDMNENEIKEIKKKLSELLDIKEGELSELQNFGIPIDKTLNDINQNKDEK